MWSSCPSTSSTGVAHAAGLSADLAANCVGAEQTSLELVASTSSHPRMGKLLVAVFVAVVITVPLEVLVSKYSVSIFSSACEVGVHACG
jgi:hypothetical protein